MNFKSIFVVIISLIFLGSSLTVATVTQKEKNIGSILNDEIAELPEWNIGNFWKYEMNFDFSVNEESATAFSVDAIIENMYATLTEIVEVNNAETYLLSLDGDINGDLSLFSAEINIADFRGDFGGEAYVGKYDLGIKKFEFEVDGEVNIPLIGWRDMDFEMNMDFIPCFDFFDFPIDACEQPWNVHIDEASLYSHIKIDVPFGESEYNSSMVFNDVMEVNRTETVGDYDTIVLDGSWGNPSNLWYASDAGYLVKVNEGLSWDDGYIESVFNLDLIDTNYDKRNLPPNKPCKPQGSSDCEVKEEYTFESKTTDPNQDDIYYMFDWGDGSNSGWLGPYPHGTTIAASHKWYNKGVYNIKAKAKDIKGIESKWSEPLSILVKGDPNVYVTIHKIEKIDEIDFDPTGQMLPPEWYYEVLLDGSISPPERYHNTNDGTYNGDWRHKNIWAPDMSHDFKAVEKEVLIKIKLMDHDEGLEGGDDDLADVSGCNHPNNDGADDSTPDKRGAIYHGKYDLVKNELLAYSEVHSDHSDFVYEENGYYITSGDFKPDLSTGYENGMKDPENDAKLYFRIENDYEPPQAMAKASEDDLRPNEEIQFTGNVVEGTPDYNWYWDFGDGITSTLQNPKHVYDSTGKYNVGFTVTDGFGETDTFTFDVEIVNSRPILTKDKVEWTGNGNLDDTFIFSVHYLDPDADDPAVKNLVIDGKERELIGSGSNSDYSLSLQGSDIGKGSHSFYFHFEDGYGGIVESSVKTFKISKTKTRSEESFSGLEKIFDLFPSLEDLFKNFEIFYI
mgnify:CR=1 FL=1